MYDVLIRHEGFNLNGSVDKVVYDSFSGTGGGFVNLFSGDSVLEWNIENGNCFNSGDSYSLNYDMELPRIYLEDGDYNVSNSSLSFKMNDTISGLRIGEVLGISLANMSLEKEIINVTDSSVLDSEVVWSVNSSFFTQSSLVYNVSSATLWVSEKNVSGIYADPNVVDDDSSGDDLIMSFTPGFFINSTNPWDSTSWVFNYSGIDKPMVWFDVDFSIADDGKQIVRDEASFTDDFSFVRGIGLVSGYLLDISKEVVSVDNSTYEIEINVANRGNANTPSGAVVTIYDFLPENFSISSAIVYSSSSWFNVALNNNSISGGDMSGTLLQWGVIPTNGLDASFDSGVGNGENNSLMIKFNITGVGDYKGLDVFITGLDPQKVDGVGSSKSVVSGEDFVDNSIGGYFMALAGVLFALILIV